MGSVSSEDGSEEGVRSYSMSADVSGSESCSSFSGPQFDETPTPKIGYSVFDPNVMLPVMGGEDFRVWDDMKKKRSGSQLTEVEMMKERFAKLLLGEDMSGGGKGVCTALAISNAITNLSATVFGELWRLEPLADQKKAMWCRDMEWLLCVSDSIVELVPSRQQSPSGGFYEIMATRPRSDLYANLPALKKLDAMLLGILDGFRDTEFSYVDHGNYMSEGNDRDGGNSSGGRPSVRQEEKWWLPCPQVPKNGLSEKERKRLQDCRDCTNQILKAAMAINSIVLAEMEIPSAYIDSLPKSGRACLGDIIYRYITAEQFMPEYLIDCLNFSSEHQTLEIINKIEAAVHAWRKKDHKKNNGVKPQKFSLGGKVMSLVTDGDKNHLLADRAETLLRSLRRRFPSLPQTSLDMNKIQYNKDVGQAILESYSRVMESLAFNIIARIDDVIFIEDANKLCIVPETKSLFSRGGTGLPIQKPIVPSPFSVQHTPYHSPFATPTIYVSTPLNRSPKRTNSLMSIVDDELSDLKLEKVNPGDPEMIWSFAGNLGVLAPSGAQERN